MLFFHSEMKWIKLFTTIVFIIGSVVESLRLPRVVVPPYKMFNENATLECPFVLGKARLYSVKWYKDNEEFFRYLPRFRPPIHAHHVQGVNVLMAGSDQRTVTLGALDMRSTGLYRCEVSAEGPSFSSAQGEGHMTVFHLPKEGPQIRGRIREEYENGEYLTLTCTSSPSFPPAKLTWYINDIPIEEGVRTIKPKNSTSILVEPKLMSSMSTLNISLEPHHFNENGEAKVRCLASISTLFWQDGDEWIVGNARKSAHDSRSTKFNVKPVFQDYREASLLVRSGSWALCSSLWNLYLTILIIFLSSSFINLENFQTLAIVPVSQLLST